MAVPAEQLASTAELQATLDAAFDLIDDCLTSSTTSLVDAFWGAEQSPTDTSSDGTSRSSPSPPSSPTPAPCATDLSTPVKPTPRPSITVSAASRPVLRADSSKVQAQKRATFQVRQKQEIARLRQEASQLAAHLGLLQLLSGGARANNHRIHHDNPYGGVIAMATVDKTHCPTRPELAALWKDMAGRHKKLRGASETENTKLRLKVAEQLKTIRSIQKLLRRHATQEVSRAGSYSDNYDAVLTLILRLCRLRQSPDRLRLSGRICRKQAAP